MTDATLERRLALLGAHARPTPVAGLPIRIFTTDQLTPIWEATEKELARHHGAPPFWAFAWAGGQALAHHVIAHPELVRGKRVLDLASGSGLAAIAAALAGAAQVAANDIDPMCEAAIAANAELNCVSIRYASGDLLDDDPPAIDVVLAADVFYERTLARRFLAFLRRAQAKGALVLAGDPGRTYFPHAAFTKVGEYGVETSAEIENAPPRLASVWRLEGSAG